MDRSRPVRMPDEADSPRPAAAARTRTPPPLVAAAFEFSPLLRAEVNRLHRASLRADFGPFVGSDCCCSPAGNVGLVTPSGRREPLRAAQGEASRKRPHSERPAGDVELRSTPFRERAAPGMACFIAVER